MSNLSLEKFVGKVAVVTGASSGIGKSIAESLGRNGLIVAGVARRLDRLQKLSKDLSGEKGKLYAFQCDLTKADEIVSLFKNIAEKLGAIHVLINNAGVRYATSLIDGDFEKWKEVMDTNVLAVAACAREAISSMKQNNIRGHVININSSTGHFIPQGPDFALYPASKHAVTALTETLRLEVNRHKLPIKITSLSPGFTKTEIPIVAYGKEAGEAFLENHTGLNPEDVAEAALYILATPDHVNVKELTLYVQWGISKK
uniref:Farnesol dehydrogenase-like n=1 Tax=Dendroctonus ponderosae TaxID=77166 RepID=J3JTI3_DENPD|nr:unknown [Dendroctonus ponderosae]